jgi:hypothetical protein
MADPIEPTPEETETESEVQAHAASPLELQELGVSDPTGSEAGVLDSSSVSLAACA